MRTIEEVVDEIENIEIDDINVSRATFIETDDKCKECKKDWTKCGRCPVMMKWLKERKVRIRNDD